MNKENVKIILDRKGVLVFIQDSMDMKLLLDLGKM